MKEMNLFGDDDCLPNYLEGKDKNSILKYSMSMKEYLKSNPQALKVQRSCNVLRYYLRYGNSYYEVLSNIINYGDNVECPEGFENSIEIWEDFMGSDTFNKDSFLMFISNCFKVYKEESKCNKFGDDYNKYLSLCRNRVKFNNYLDNYLYIKNFRLLGVAIKNNSFKEYIPSSPISLLENYAITDLYTKYLDNISDDLLLTYIEEIYENPIIKSIMYTILCICFKSVDRNKCIRLNEFYSYYNNLMFENEGLNNVLCEFFEYVLYRFRYCGFDNYRLHKFLVVGYHIKYYLERNGVDYKLDS